VPTDLVTLHLTDGTWIVSGTVTVSVARPPSPFHVVNCFLKTDPLGFGAASAVATFTESGGFESIPLLFAQSMPATTVTLSCTSPESSDVAANAWITAVAGTAVRG
jgi:hypothetical protein